MAEHSSFFNSVSGDRKYQASDYAAYFNSFIANGVFPNPGTNLQVVTNSNMTVTVSIGKGWINGYFYLNDAILILPIEVADGVLKRVDRIVLQLNTISRSITAKVKKGTFASTPVAPVLQRDADAYELGIADVYIANGATSIFQANITDLRMNTGLCGWVNSLIQADTTAIFNQYLDWYAARKDEYNVDFLNWTTSERNAYDIWYAALTSQTTEDIAELEMLFQQDIIVWFENIKGLVDEDAAISLASKILDIGGVGRTTETVKGVSDEQAAHEIDAVKHLSSEERGVWSGKQDQLPIERTRKITFGTASPTGGNDGDIYFQYE